MSRYRRPVRASFALLLVAGCGEESDAPTTPPANPLAGVTLAETSATSLGRVEIEGLPAGRASASAGAPSFRLLLLHEDGGELDLGLERDEDTYYFYAPIHPDQPNEGGVLRLVVDDGSHRSPELPLTVDAGRVLRLRGLAVRVTERESEHR